MALTDSGHAALTAILTQSALFERVKDKDLIAAAVKLARKQVTAAGLSIEDLLTLKSTLGADVFDKTLQSLSPHHVKQLARRLDKAAPELEVNTGSSALAYVRKLLDGGSTIAEMESESPSLDDAVKKKNKYLGRKAFRTGR